ncbi:MAG: polysaccharide deacetylase family protein [Clostridia bacterium]|nr:polysaccharide deacetylase family protein [Clostridia bacterium]
MRKFIKVFTLTIISIFIISISVMGIKQRENSITQNTIATSTSSLSNQKIGWGIKRADNHEQPDLGSKNKELINKYQGIAMGNSEKKYVYLTFDEGYEAGYTPRILQVLKENDVKACFFLTAHFVNTQEGLVKEMIEGGHTIGNHTVNHKSMPDLTDEKVKSEVMDLHTVVYQKFGYEMKYIRPPRGEFSERTISITNSLGYTTVMWSLAYDDWDENKQGREEYAKKKILDNIHPGAVILLHGNSKDNTNVLDEVIKEVKNMGYEFKKLDEFAK